MSNISYRRTDGAEIGCVISKQTRCVQEVKGMNRLGAALVNYLTPNFLKYFPMAI